jgi:hypothetical protein
MKVYYFIVLIIIFGCTNNLNYNADKLKSSTNKIINTKNKLEISEDIAPEKLSNLFYENVNINYSNTMKRKNPENINLNQPQSQNQITGIDSNDYKVIVDWMVSDTRYIKLKNLKTNTETVIKDSDKNSPIILVERNLFFYKFKINGQIIEVKR